MGFLYKTDAAFWAVLMHAGDQHLSFFGCVLNLSLHFIRLFVLAAGSECLLSFNSAYVLKDCNIKRRLSEFV